MRRAKRQKAHLQVALSIELNSTYGRQKLQGILAYMRKNPGWQVPLREAQPLLPWRELKKWRGDGIIGEFLTEGEIDEVLALGVPVVNTALTLQRDRVPTVGNDDIGIGEEAAKHLLGLGVEGFHYFAQPQHRFSKDRWQAFARIVRSQGRVARAHWIEEDDQNALLKAGHYLKALKATDGRCGIFCATDRIAYGVSEACRKLNLPVPNQMAILGVNNDEVICQLANPPLSSIDEGATAVGYRAAELLAGLMAGQAAPKRRIRLPHAGLRQRASTNVLATGNNHLAAALRFIQEHEGDPIYVPDVLKATTLSRRSLEMLFEKGVGHGIYKEIRIVHVRRAERLLRETSLSILNIAQQSGFTSIHSFETAFQSVNRCSPSQYRRKHLTTSAD